MRRIPFRHRRAQSDLDLLRTVREGRPRMFLHLWLRHHAAVLAYAATCASSAGEAGELTDFAFRELFRGAVAVDAAGGERHEGCVRIQLLGLVRMRAVHEFVRGSRPPSPFQAWMHSGSVWSMLDDRRLCEAFDLLTPTDRTLLWHWLVERDGVRDIAAVSGVAANSLPARLMLAHHNLRETRTDIYRARSECGDCMRAAGGIDRLVHGTWTPADFQGLSLCRECQYLYDDVVNLNDWLVWHLPARLLGWWPGDQYTRNKTTAARRSGGMPPRRASPVRGGRAAPRHARRRTRRPERRPTAGPGPRHARRRRGRLLNGRMARALREATAGLVPSRPARPSATDPR
ncbi:hypothetical protein [Streptomyces sp. NPDC047028]|uniref:hypothetical protein n=1 Tax=Streptomyces sp. NPDC047028 TaxID=3155793 RepID=UPI0033F66CA0